MPGGQENLDRKETRNKEDAVAETTDVSEETKERQDKLAEDVDTLLDEIDDVLEVNAEEFVKGFVQKGGQ